MLESAVGAVGLSSTAAETTTAKMHSSATPVRLPVGQARLVGEEDQIAPRGVETEQLKLTPAPLAKTTLQDRQCWHASPLIWSWPANWQGSCLGEREQPVGPFSLH